MSLFLVVIFIAILAAAGLIVDGGAKLRAAREASAVAEEAARAGAAQIDRNRAYSRGGRFTIDHNAALTAARAYLSHNGISGRVSVSSAQTIRVTVTITRPTTLLSAIGVNHVHATKTATGNLIQGIRTENQ